MAKQAKQAKQVPGRSERFFRFFRFFRSARGGCLMSALGKWRDIGEVLAGAEARDVDAAPDLHAFLALRPDWMERAACRRVGVADFFAAPGQQEARERAKELCRGCGVREDCLSYSLEFPVNFFGIWGGATPEQRRQLRKAREAA